MELVLSFIILLVFVLVTGFGLYIVKQNNKQIPEQFKSVFNPTKFYTTSPNKEEKLNSLYSPIIWRPKDIYAHKYGGRCTNELYPKAPSKMGKGEMAGPCKPDVAGKYYGMRPILSPETLQGMIGSIFSDITTTAPIDDSKLIHQNQFCEGDSYSSVMKFVLRMINESQARLKVFKDYAKADTWGGDQFAYLNEEIFMFTEQNPNMFSQQQQAIRARKNNKKDTKFVLNFTLYLPLRSTSLDTTAIVIEHNRKLYITYIGFTTQKGNGKGPESVNISNPKSGDIIQPDFGGLPPQQNTPNWIYGNSLENKTFNLKGFHDPDENMNILIPGGVPQEYLPILEKCDQGYLMKPANSSGPRFKGGFQSNLTTQEPPIYPNFPNKKEVWTTMV